jgi:Cys-tRNA(Pro)/Cys-tRNA(Cys) deacylase
LNLQWFCIFRRAKDNRTAVIEKTTMPTRAVNQLTRQGVAFEIVRYEHEEKGAEYAARATGFPLERTIKTLVVDLGSQRYVLALVPGNHRLDLKLLSNVCAVKRAAMADADTAERLTGYSVGGISPFGVRRRIPAILEKSVVEHDQILINAGRRGLMLKMRPADIVRALQCRLAEISPT